MGFDRALADPEIAGNLLGHPAIDQATEHVPFALGQ